MFVTVLGITTSQSHWKDKTTGEEIPVQNVAVDDKAFAIRCEDGTLFKKMTPVVVQGDLKVYERNWSLNGAKIRKATEQDIELYGRPDDEQEVDT